MFKRSTSAGLAFLIVIVIGVLLLASVSSAIPASGLVAQEAKLAATPPAAAADDTAQPVETSQPQGVSPAAQGLDQGSVMFVENAGQWDPGARFQVWGGPAGTVWLAEDAIWITVVSRQVDQEQADKEQMDQAAASLSGGKGEPCDESQVSLFPCLLTPQQGVNIKLSFVGANPQPRIVTFDPQETVVSYFLGNDPEQWRPEVPVWGGVRYVELYPGVNLELSGENGQMMPRLAARPGADLSAVRLRVDGTDAVSVDGDVLRLSTAAGEFDWPLLAVDWIGVGGAQAEESGVKAFDVVEPFVRVNSHRPAASDSQRFPADNPADLIYGTFLGGSDSNTGAGDTGYAIDVDGTGSAYVTGETSSSNFPTTPGAFRPSINGYEDAFVAKLNPAGSGLTFATFLGGSSSDTGVAIAVDGTGSAYVTGTTRSDDFPTTPGSFDPIYNHGNDAFVAKVNPTGSGLTYATFLGRGGEDYGNAISVDASGNAYVTGVAGSYSFPTTPGAFDTWWNGGYSDAFVAKLNASGNALVYATFLGGSDGDGGSAITVDGAGWVYVAGWTGSSDFPSTPGAFDPSQNGGTCGSRPCADAFVAKLNPAGSGLAYATFLGGGPEDAGLAIAIDETGSAYVTGKTGSYSFPTTAGAFDTSYNGGTCSNRPCFDAFVAKLNPAGSALAYATFLGGSHDDYGVAIAVDGTGNVYVTGRTGSSGFPSTPGAFNTIYNGGTCSNHRPCDDAFVAKLNPTGSGLAYATFLGGGLDDQGNDIVLDEAGNAYVTGGTFSSNLPTTAGAFDPSINGYEDAFVAKLAVREVSATATPTATPTVTSTPTRTPSPIPLLAYLPLVLHRFPPIPDAPALNAITAPGANPSYSVRWNASQSATSYLLQRATSAGFADAVQVYSGAATTYSAPSQGIARYYYRVQARNQYGSSPWSNVQWVDVRWEQEPNYPLAQANGPLLSGFDYYGYPNDSNDYFFFQVASRGEVAIDLSNHTGTGVQLVLRTVTGDQVAVDYQAPYHLVTTVDPGRYYVQIYTESGLNTNTPYTLRVIFP